MLKIVNSIKNIPSDTIYTFEYMLQMGVHCNSDKAASVRSTMVVGLLIMGYSCETG